MSRPHWGWQDPLEAALLPAVSADELMGHARTIARWERESGSTGEARWPTSWRMRGPPRFCSRRRRWSSPPR